MLHQNCNSVGAHMRAGAGRCPILPFGTPHPVSQESFRTLAAFMWPSAMGLAGATSPTANLHGGFGGLHGGFPGQGVRRSDACARQPLPTQARTRFAGERIGEL